ncbi:DUF5686 family protein [Persicobacter diffluens]|uniref:Carboxypeptidase-like regulatory domain-containing protein n=1 Tax=Persicobacter diffluens TaxID=981 RepID=A0AAN5AK30_9BACT|nr:hypothetical protein PEDI_20190 [Persicobacter diffluens]
MKKDKSDPHYAMVNGVCCAQILRLLLLLVLFSPLPSHAEKSMLKLKGLVLDLDTGEPLLFATISIRNAYGVGCQTDLEGKFELLYDEQYLSESLVIQFVGYETLCMPVEEAAAEEVFYLKEHQKVLSEVVIEAGENPAFEFIRKHQASYQLQQKAQEGSWQSQVEVSWWASPEKQWMQKDLDRYGVVGVDGKQAIPVVSAEYEVEKVYAEGRMTENHYQNVKQMALGFDARGIFGQLLVNPDLLIHDLMCNQLVVIDKNFPSPFSLRFAAYFDWDLKDNPIEEDGQHVWMIHFEPRSKSQQGFEGDLYFNTSDSTLVKVNMKMAKRASQNFWSDFALTQYWQPDEKGENWPAITQYHQSLEDVPLYGQVKAYYKIQEGAMRKNAEEILSNPPLAEVPQGNSIQLLEEMNQKSRAAHFNRSINIAASGYWETPKWDVGHAMNYLILNDLEGYRLSVSGLSDRLWADHIWVKSGIGFGLEDEKWKYQVAGKWLINPQQRQILSINTQYDLIPVSSIGFESEMLEADYHLAQIGALSEKMPFYQNKSEVSLSQGFRRDWTITVGGEWMDLRNANQFLGKEAMTAGHFASRSAKMEVRWSFKDRSAYNKNYRLLRKGGQPFPEVKLGVKAGFVHDQQQEQAFQQLYLQLDHQFAPLFSKWGQTSYRLNAGKVLGNVPFPYLKMHQGIGGPVYAFGSHQLMNSFEFTSDQYVELFVQHFFGGALMSKVPGLAWLHEQTGAGIMMDFEMAYGTLSRANAQYNEVFLTEGQPLNSLGRHPYMAAGVGVHNIFKFFFVEYWHRLSYQQMSYGSNDQALKVGLVISL